MKGQTCGRLPSLEVGEGGVCLLFMGFLDLEGFALSWRDLLAMEGFALLRRGLLAVHGFSCFGGVCFVMEVFALLWRGLLCYGRVLLAVERLVEGFACCAWVFLRWRGLLCCAGVWFVME